jgi:hypothetical protein
MDAPAMTTNKTRTVIGIALDALIVLVPVGLIVAAILLQ